MPRQSKLTAQLTWVETWLNRPDVKKALGVPSKLTFTGCNMKVNQAFMMQGDGMHNSAELIPPMLDAGIRFLICALGAVASPSLCLLLRRRIAVS